MNVSCVADAKAGIMTTTFGNVMMLLTIIDRLILNQTG